MLQNIVAELKLLHSQIEQKFENTFITKTAAKLSTDLRYRKSQHYAAEFIVESFGDMNNDNSFISWLAQKLNYQKCRLQQISKAYLQSQKSKPSRSLPENTQQKIYEFWLLPENSIMSTNRQ